MKKDILAIGGILLILAAILCGVHIRSVDDYYRADTTGTTDAAETTTESETVTIGIRCDTILDNYDDLDPALRSEEFVPSDGVILPPTTYELHPGDTVFDVLSRAVRDNRIQMEYQGADQNRYGGVYIQGIHYLYEFSCGPLSGWTYRVDGEFPNYSCAQYVLKGGQTIEWLYTCDLGRDVGCEWTEAAA